MAQSGFLLYASDWAEWTQDYTDAEIGAMLKAVLAFFATGEITEFDDRGMRQFFRMAAKSIERDRAHYEERCLKNQHNRYVGICKRQGIDFLDYDEWKEQVLTNVDDRQEPSREVNEPLPTTIPATTPSTATEPSTVNISNGRDSEGRETKYTQLDWIKAREAGNTFLADEIRKELGF